MAKKENNRITTPKVEAMWACVTKPTNKYQTKGARPEDQEYKITVLLNPNVEEHQLFMKKLKELWIECGKEKKCPKGQPKNFPAKKHFRKEDGSDTGLFEVSFRSNAEYKPRIFDAKGTPVTGELLVGNGSIVRVSGNYSFYGPELSGAGVKLYLSAVQVIELVEWKGGSAADYGFDAQQGYDVEAGYKDDFAPPVTDSDVPASDSVDPDGLPF